MGRGLDVVTDRAVGDEVGRILGLLALKGEE